MDPDNFTTLNIDENFDEAIQLACDLFFSGKIFIYPTDTIYGMGCNPKIRTAVQRIIDIKGREESKYFIWLISDIESMLNYASIEFDNQLELLEKIWPGPVSIILNLNNRARELFFQDSAAFRVPDSNFCTKLLQEIKLPLISTSVNKSNEIPMNNPVEIINEFKDVDAVFYSDKETLSVTSTIIDFRYEKPVLVREGAIKFVEFLAKFN